MKEYKNKTTQELKKLIEEKRAVIRNFRFGNTGGKEKNVKLSYTTRKEIARIMTELSIQSKAQKAVKTK